MVSRLLKSAIGIKIVSWSVSCVSSNCPSVSSAKMIFRLAFSVTKEATTQVNKIRIIVPFKILASIIPALYPTKIMASVAAACALLSPKIICLCSFVYLNNFWVIKEAIHFPQSEVMVKDTATIKAIGPLKSTRTFTNIPTLIKKKGIKIALPTNSIRFISMEVCGINRFKASPAKNAPIMGSTPATCAKKAAKKTTESTKT